MNAVTMVFAFDTLASVGLGVAALAARPCGRVRATFGLGMVGFAVEAAAGYVLMLQAQTADERLLWLRVREVAAVLLLIPWLAFVVCLAHERGRRLGRAVLFALAVGMTVLGGSAAAVLRGPIFDVADVSARFYAARVQGAGRLGVLVQILVTVAIIAGLEAALRCTRGETRWRTKYLVLGLGAVFLVRFYFLSQVALFNVLMASYLTTAGITLLIGNALIAVSLARDRLALDITVSRQVVYRSVAVGTLGLYLVAIGALGWLLNRVGLPEEFVWGSVLIFVSSVALAAVMLSEAVRWRIKRLIATHLYRSKYDYRAQWMAFTKRLAPLTGLDRLAPQLLHAVTDAVGAMVAMLYVADPASGAFRPAASLGPVRTAGPLRADAMLLEKLAASPFPLIVGGGRPLEALPQGLTSAFGRGSAVVPLRWRDELTGVLLVGPERTGTPYGPEDLHFLATVGEQAAATLVSARLAEQLTQAREFEAFHRLTSFVIHDLKNSISALSLLSQNALEHFDDPEFRRDAITTLGRTVQRMTALLGRLSSPHGGALRLQSIDLADLVLEALRPLTRNDRVAFVKDLDAVPPIPGDPDALLKVVQNLLTNALQAIDGPGTVTVKTYKEGEAAVISVADTGRGMSEEFICGSLFAPFRTTKKGGWGIGLYQVKSIVEAHGGTVDVSSREGTGTTFRVVLPTAPKERR
jgi:putative PEP-CTERM system histidine kinase